MNIILFGGSFDPPHIGHLTMAENVLSFGIAEEVWFIPCGQHSFHKKMSPAHHRKQMVELIVKDKMKVSDYEINKKGESVSYETLLHFKTLYPQHTFSWLIGTDQLSSFHKWGDYRKLLREFRFYVYPRTGYPFEPLDEGMVSLKNMPSVKISSTDVRKKVSQGEDLSRDLSPQVITYIKDHSLYNKV